MSIDFLAVKIQEDMQSLKKNTYFAAYRRIKSLLQLYNPEDPLVTSACEILSTVGLGELQISKLAKLDRSVPVLEQLDRMELRKIAKKAKNGEELYEGFQIPGTEIKLDYMDLIAGLRYLGRLRPSELSTLEGNFMNYEMFKN